MFYHIYAIRYAQLNLFPTIHFLDLRVVSNSETESIVKQRLREMWKIGRKRGWDGCIMEYKEIGSNDKSMEWIDKKRQ